MQMTLLSKTKVSRKCPNITLICYTNTQTHPCTQCGVKIGTVNTLPSPKVLFQIKVCFTREVSYHIHCSRSELAQDKRVHHPVFAIFKIYIMSLNLSPFWKFWFSPCPASCIFHFFTLCFSPNFHFYI